MTLRDFNYTAGTTDKTQANITPATQIRGYNIYDQELLSRIINAPAIYKNYGYYVAGSIWETWISTGFPSTANPTGHTLTLVQNIRVA